VEEWCINKLVQDTKTCGIVLRNENYTPSSFCERSHDIRFWGPASNVNALAASFKNTVKS
jgi:hypothetical protein